MKHQSENTQMPSDIHPGNKSACHLTTVHPRSDTRIFIKETQTLASLLPLKCILMVADGKGNEDKGQGFVSIHDVGRLGSGRFGRAIIGSWRTFWAIRKLKPAILHFHDPELIFLGLILKGLGYKVIYDVHEDYPRQTLSKHYLPWIIRKPVAWVIHVAEMLGAKAFNGIISATPKIAERFPVNKTAIVCNFPLLQELSFVSQKIEKKRVFCYIGGLFRTRGLFEMLNAVELVDAELHLAGDFTPGCIEDEVRRHKAWNKLNYLGFINRKEVYELMSKSVAGLVILHPLQSYKDSLPIKMFEYMSAGIPIICSDFDIWKSIVVKEKCGICVNPKKIENIAEAMNFILNNSDIAKIMGENGKKAVLEKYNWNNEAHKLIDFYNSLIN